MYALFILLKASGKRLVKCVPVICLGLCLSFMLNAQETSQEQQDSTSFDSIVTDFQKDMNIRSDDQELDGKAKTSILIDNVVIQQGSLEIKADRVEADASKGNEVITATGKPASYRQRLEDGSYVSALANAIVYNVATKTITLTGNAEITKDQSKVTASSITYDMLNDKINASSDGNNEGKVNTVISFGDQDENDEGVN